MRVEGGGGGGQSDIALSDCLDVVCLDVTSRVRAITCTLSILGRSFR